MFFESPISSARGQHLALRALPHPLMQLIMELSGETPGTEAFPAHGLGATDGWCGPLCGKVGWRPGGCVKHEFRGNEATENLQKLLKS